MLPLQAFNVVWARADSLRIIYKYLAANVTDVLRPDELLRAEWVLRVSALDLYVHELVAQRMLESFLGVRPEANGFGKFQLSATSLTQIRASSTTQAASLFDLAVRSRLSLVSYQHPDKIAEGVRLVSNVALWKAVARHIPASPLSVDDRAKDLRKQLSLIVERRNKIAHEGDLQPGLPRTEWPIQESDVELVKSFIADVTAAFDVVIT